MRAFLSAALSYLVFLFCITIHEFSHALFADRFGDSTPRRAGRLTLNPLPHMDLFGTVLLPLLGIISAGAVIGFAQTPVDPSAMRPRRWGPALTVLAGPASNAVVCVGAALAAGILGKWPVAGLAGGLSDDALSFVEGARMALLRVGVLSGVLAIFNLLPAGPLDGALFWRYSFPESSVTAVLSSPMIWLGILALFLFMLAGPTVAAVQAVVGFLAGIER